MFLFFILNVGISCRFFKWVSTFHIVFVVWVCHFTNPATADDYLFIFIHSTGKFYQKTSCKSKIWLKVIFRIFKHAKQFLSSTIINCLTVVKSMWWVVFQWLIISYWLWCAVTRYIHQTWIVVLLFGMFGVKFLDGWMPTG